MRVIEEINRSNIITRASLNGMQDKDLFEFEYEWDPYTNKIKKDPNGPLYFDPNALINYFYTNRLNNLWIKDIMMEMIIFKVIMVIRKISKFEIKGRGPHPSGIYLGIKN